MSPTSRTLDAPERSKRGAKRPKLYRVVRRVATRENGFVLLNEDALFKEGAHVFLTPPGRRGFRQYPVRPKFLSDPKIGRVHRDFEALHDYWLISDRMKDILERVDPNAFAFLQCDITTSNGGSAAARWLCDVVLVLDALVEGSSEVRIGTADNGSKIYLFTAGARLIFDESVVGQAHVFRMKFFEPAIFCDEKFALACKSAKLAGVSFMPVNK
jgi:hypothetical protein